MKRTRPGDRAFPAIDADGWIGGGTRVPSPNFDDRPPGTPPWLIVVHGISLPPGRFGGPGIAALFGNRLHARGHPYFARIAGLRVSAHFLVRRDGKLVQFVSCDRRAWHAGASSWRGVERCNDFSIGIEVEGTDAMPYTGRQYATLARLTRALCRRYPIVEAAGHSDVAPGRKSDPGPAFDWRRLRRRLGPRAAKLRLPH
jgi:N-acetyl-anhydromuramoyl-L-alanine amidase